MSPGKTQSTKKANHRNYIPRRRVILACFTISIIVYLGMARSSISKESLKSLDYWIVELLVVNCSKNIFIWFVLHVLLVLFILKPPLYKDGLANGCHFFLEHYAIMAGCIYFDSQFIRDTSFVATVAIMVASV